MQIQTTRYFTISSFVDGTQTLSHIGGGRYSLTCMFFQAFDAAPDAFGRIPNSANPIPIANLSGTVTIEVSEDGINWGAVTNGTVNFGGGYDRPIVCGCGFRHVRMTLAGVSGTGLQSLRLVMDRG